jgi:hypothetical protein
MVSNFGHISGSASYNVEPASYANGRPTSFAHSRERSIRCGEPTMVEPSKLSRDILPFTVSPNAIAALERVRDSYKGKSKPGVLTGADQAVLAAVKITLKHLARAS